MAQGVNAVGAGRRTEHHMGRGRDERKTIYEWMGDRPRRGPSWETVVKGAGRDE